MNNLILENSGEYLTATIDRQMQHNSINAELLSELHTALDMVEADNTCHALIIQGKEKIFCTGMDFDALTASINAGNGPGFSISDYMSLLKRFTSSSRFIIAKVDGRALAGGIGIVAASDFVLSTPNSQFGLSEALWGLLPANVLPFLIRRIGFQPAYRMTLSTRDISAVRAYELGLVDELHENLEDGLHKLMTNLRRIQTNTVEEAKRFFKKLWIINENVENTAIAELEKLIQEPHVLQNISNFIQNKKLPWENS